MYSSALQGAGLKVAQVFAQMVFDPHTEQGDADGGSAAAELKSDIQQGAAHALAERTQGQDTLPFGCGRLELRLIEAIFQ